MLSLSHSLSLSLSRALSLSLALSLALLRSLLCSTVPALPHSRTQTMCCKFVCIPQLPLGDVRATCAPSLTHTHIALPPSLTHTSLSLPHSHTHRHTGIRAKQLARRIPCPPPPAFPRQPPLPTHSTPSSPPAQHTTMQRALFRAKRPHTHPRTHTSTE